MTRMDWVIARRLLSRIGMTVAVFFGLFCLIDSLDAGKFNALAEVGGPLLGFWGITVSASRVVLTLSAQMLLVGTILAVLDLQSRRELTIIKSAGMSIWRILRLPILIALGLGAFVAFVGDSAAILATRQLPTAERSTEVWVEQQGADGNFILHGERTRQQGSILEDVSIFFTDVSNRLQIRAPAARLVDGAWELSDATLYRVGAAPETIAQYRVATATTAGDMRLRVSSAGELTFAELVNIVSQNVADPTLRASALTSLLRLLAVPALFVGSVLMAFAFTSGYRRTNKYGAAAVYGVLLGFMVYVVTELAYRSGYAGVLDPTFAAAGPAFVAIVIGLTVLLYKEDGRA